LNQHITKVTIFFSLIYYNLKVSIFNRTNILFLFNMNRLEACLVLRLLPSFGNIRGRKLLEFCKTPEAVFDTNPKDFLTIDGIGASHLSQFKKWKSHLKEVEKEIAFIEKHQIQTIFLGDPNYPKTLEYCPDAPLVLFAKGNFSLEKRKIISIVGTRKNDLYGQDFCQELIKDLTVIDPIIVSGFAYGIDIIAHQQALKSGLDTVGCLAHGFDKIYPKEHKKYIRAIEKKGGFVTDFTSSEVFDRNNFLRRNRIIAGLAHATVVIQSNIKGGSMNTADYAHQYNRDLFALPGLVTNKLSGGCHQLIRNQKAQIITSANDLMYAMGWESDDVKKGVQKLLFIELNEEEKIIFNHLKNISQDNLDNISLSTKFSISKAATLLMQLEMKGCIRPLPGKHFEWI